MIAVSSYLNRFVAELRRPLITIYQYRPILFVGPEEPAHWDKICRLYDDVRKHTPCLTLEHSLTNPL